MSTAAPSLRSLTTGFVVRGEAGHHFRSATARIPAAKLGESLPSSPRISGLMCEPPDGIAAALGIATGLPRSVREGMLECVVAPPPPPRWRWMVMGLLKLLRTGPPGIDFTSCPSIGPGTGSDRNHANNRASGSASSPHRLRRRRDRRAVRARVRDGPAKTTPRPGSPSDAESFRGP